jgi:hypothetical protein
MMQVFRCIPTDSATDFPSLRRFQEELKMCYRDPLAAQQKLKDVQVRHGRPLHFKLCTFTFCVAVYQNKELEQLLPLTSCVN